MSVMRPAAAGQWEQAGAIFVRCELSIKCVRPYLPSSPSPSPPPFFNTGNFPKKKQLSFSLSRVDYHNNFLFHLRAGFFWKPLKSSSEHSYCPAVAEWLAAGSHPHCETWESIYKYLQVGKGPLTFHVLDVEAGSISPRVILRVEIWIWTGHGFHRGKIHSKCLHPIRCNEKKYMIKMVISAPKTEYSVIFMTLFSEHSF